MPNTAYPLGAQKILSGSVNFASDTIKMALLPSSYTFSAAHEFLSALGSRIGTDQTLANKSVAGGVLDGDDLDYGALAPGSTVKALVVYKDTGNSATSPVLFYFDVITGFPFATNGGALTVPWGNDAKKIARLGLPFFPLGAEKVFSGAINFLADTIKVALLPAAYVYDEAHEFLDDVGSIIGTAQTLGTKTVIGGVFDAADASFGALGGGSDIGSLLIYKDTGTAGTSPVLLHITDSVTLPLPTNGSAVSHQWSNGSAKIFSLIPA
jgi:hypothetical protein